MISKNEAKYIQSLQQKKNRAHHGTFVVEGVKMFEELCASDLMVAKIYTDSQIIFQQAQALFGDDRTHLIHDFELKKISALQTPNDVLAVVKMPIYTDAISDDFVIALDGIQDPGNLGTIIRLADWFGIRTVVASEDSADCYNPKVVQATMGSIFRVQTRYLPLQQFFESAKDRPVYGALLSGNTLYGTERVARGVLVIGNESKGISEAVKKQIQHAITIPGKGAAESLNAAVATGIILSHLLK